MKKLLTLKQELSLIEFYKNCRSNSKTAEAFNVKVHTVYSTLQRHNQARIAYRKQNFKYNIDAFSEYKSDYKAAYFYGLLLTDGCLTKDNGIQLSLKSTDSFILEEFNKYIGSSSPLNHRVTEEGHESLSASFKNRLIVDRLKEQGLTSRKSGNEKLPKFNWLTNPDFFRGLLDGDGFITISSSGSSSVTLYNSLEVVNGFIKFVESFVDIKKKRIPSLVRSFENGALYSVGFHGKEAAEILKVVYYEDCLSIPRKVEKVKVVIKNQKEGKYGSKP